MRCRPLIFLFLAAFAGAESGAADREIKRVFAVEPGAELMIDTPRGEIVIEESDRHEVRVTVVLEAVAASAPAAARLLERVQVEMVQHGNRVAIVARNPGESGLRFTWSEDDRVDFTFRISVPRRCDVAIEAIEASATVGNLSGRMSARIEKGRVFFRRIDGAVNARVDFGDIIVSRCSGPVTGHVLRGLIRLGTVGGRAELTNKTGDIEVMVVRDSIVAEAQAGEIRVGLAPGVGASRLSVAGGNIVASFHAQTAGRIDAASTWGRVKSTLPLAVDAGGDGRRTLAGRLNGGGPLIDFRASGGDVRLDATLELFDDGG